MIFKFMQDAAGVTFQKKWHDFRLLLLTAAILMPAFVCVGETSTNKTAEVKISGFGFFGNRDLIHLLENFQTNRKLPSVLRPSFVEDATVMLFSKAVSEGFLKAKLEVTFTLTNGNQMGVLWTNALQADLSRDFAASAAHFEMLDDVRFYYHSIEFNGLEAISSADAKSYFVTSDSLLHLRADRIYNPARLQDSMAALQEVLARKGYRDASVKSNELQVNGKSGAVDLKLKIDEGLPTYVRSVAVFVTTTNASNTTTNLETLHPDRPYSRLWQEDMGRRLQAKQFERGYPDTTVAFKVLRLQTNADRIEMDLSAKVNPGPRVRVGKVIYSGNHQTRSFVIKSRVSIEPGDWLNPLAAEESRQRLAGLGVFDSVQLSYQQTNSNAHTDTRNVIYDLKETKPISLSLLAGYGSYEMLRGGLEWEDRNVLGLAHDLRIRGVQSFKSTSGEGQYTVPEVFGADLNAFVKGSGLRRQEVSFVRKEYGGSVGVQKYLAPIKTDMSIRYDYEFLNSYNLSTTNADSIGVTNARSAAIVIDLSRDRRQTPLLPVRGLKLFTTIELASDALGGNVNYQRILLGGSYHMHLIDGLLLHLGVTHGVSFTLGGDSEQLPFNKRFFPGGENSIRGYQEGQASPLDANGNQLGAETYTLGNVELEQLITKSWSIVAFFDALGMAQHRRDYPWDQGLFSVGGGICWRTPIGPVRLEYGYNLKRRHFDPMGTLHFSVGFPF